MNKPIKSVSRWLLLAALASGTQLMIPTQLMAAPVSAQQSHVLKGKVVDETGQPAVGAAVIVVGTTMGATVEVDGSFSLKNVKKGATLRISLIGYKSQIIKWDGTSQLNIQLKEDNTTLGEVVVTAMGITRKAASLTYATQQLKADELMKVQDPNLVNSIEGKISGVTITPAAGGAGGASKILLRGNKSIEGNNAPLIVVDGIPMTNNTRGQITDKNRITAESGAEGGDPLSMINPDDIESMNILKGANAAALYGSAAANGVVMITTKKGKEGKLDINFTSNITFDAPLLTPQLQRVYGGRVGNEFKQNAWGEKLAGTGEGYLLQVPTDANVDGGSFDAHLRRVATDNVADFFRTGVTTNNSASLSGGTEKMRSYFSFANSHAKGMTESNQYNRNTISFRQNYKFWNRLHFDISANYVQTRTHNRVGGGTVGNPIYDLYTLPADVDLPYYRNHYTTMGKWQTNNSSTYYVLDKWGNYKPTTGRARLGGLMQNWVYQAAGENNPYWLINQNRSVQQDDRFYGSLQGKIDLYDGLAFQARVSIDHSKFHSESKKYATTWDPSAMNNYGRYWLTNSRSNEIYTDYLLSYNKQISDYTLSATAGWVGHLINGTNTSTDATATFDNTHNGILTELPTIINRFDTSSGGMRTTHTSHSSNWDKAALFTAQVGWREMVYLDASYRHDWYRAFRQVMFAGTPDNYGYFGLGGNAILSELMGWKDKYVKYRVSYSEVGNSIPNIVFNTISKDERTGAVTFGGVNNFTPSPEKVKSFETGVESQFFNNRLNIDLTYYNSALTNAYIVTMGTNGKAQPVNSARIRNQGLEATIGYDWNNLLPGLRWKTSVNFSYNFNRVEKTYRNEAGTVQSLRNVVAQGVQVLYEEGGQYGDLYVNDFSRWRDDVYKDASGRLNSTGQGTLVHKKGDIYVNKNGAPSLDGNFRYVNDKGGVQVQGGKKYGRYLGNMNSDMQLSWSNTFNYKGFSLYMLINGRIGGKVISLTESYLDVLGLSQRTADARITAEAQGLKTAAGEAAMYINEGRDLVPIRAYYEALGSKDASSYVYSATNFRLRELSLGYTWRDLLGEGKHVSLSAIGRNLFFFYKDAPTDPDVSLSTANGLGAFEMFNLPSTRSFGFNLKVNF